MLPSILFVTFHAHYEKLCLNISVSDAEGKCLHHEGGRRKLDQTRLWINKQTLYVRESTKDDEKQYLNEMVEQNPRVSSLMNRLGLRLGDSDDVSLN